MKQQKLSTWIWVSSAVSVLLTFPARADVVQVSPVQLNLKNYGIAAKQETGNTEIPRLNEIARPATTVAEWLSQSSIPNAQSQSPIQVTDVQLNSTESGGIDVILETAGGETLEGSTSTEGNSLIVDIPNAQLQLPGKEFRSDNPSEGIRSVLVSQLNVNTIQVQVTGVADVPKGQLVTSDRGLVISLTPTDTTNPIPEEDEIEIVVTGEREEGYRVEESTTGTKIPLPQRDIPQSIQVIPRQVIEDRQVVRLNELTDNVSGVQRVPGYGGLSSLGVRIRGFTLQFENLRNGFRDFGYQSPRDVANVERVEILKGPASVLYGGGVVGFSGQVNTVTEKPLDEPRYQLEVVAGSYDFYRPTLDFTGPLTSDNSLLYRLNLAYETANSFRDFNENESFFVAPALTWRINPRTNLTVEFESQKYSYFFDNGFPAEPEFLKLPRDRFLLGEPDFNNAEFITNSITYNFEHQLSDNWKFRQGFNTLLSTGETASAFFGSLEDDRRTLPRDAFKTDEEQENYTLQNELSGEFNTGSLRHNFLFGVELARFIYDFTFFGASLDPIDILAPVYGSRPGEFGAGDRTRYGADNLGIYLQDLIEILPNLKLLAGVRFDLNDSFRNNFEEEVPDIEQTDSDFSPRIGIVYQPSQDTSLYFSYSRSFAPQFFGRSRTNEQFEPSTGKQFEAGIKQDLFDNRLSATLALYQLNRQNVLTIDPENRLFRIQTGEQRSRGIELDIAGELLPGWNIIATYAYTDAIVTEDNNIPEGDRLDGTPEHSASLWTTYEIQSGSLQGLGFGAGVVFIGEREAQLPNTIALRKCDRTDMMSY